MVVCASFGGSEGAQHTKKFFTDDHMVKFVKLSNLYMHR